VLVGILCFGRNERHRCEFQSSDKNYDDGTELTYLTGEGMDMRNFSTSAFTAASQRVTADAACMPGAATAPRPWLRRIVRKLIAAHRARQRAAVARIIRSGLAAVD
jgi:hypothetical protein